MLWLIIIICQIFASESGAPHFKNTNLKSSRGGIFTPAHTPYPYSDVTEFLHVGSCAGRNQLC